MIDDRSTDAEADDYAASVVTDAQVTVAAENLIRCALDGLRAIGCGDDPLVVEAERLLRANFGKGRPS